MMGIGRGAPACGIEREALTPLWRREQGKEMGIEERRGSDHRSEGR